MSCYGYNYVLCKRILRHSGFPRDWRVCFDGPSSQGSNMSLFFQAAVAMAVASVMASAQLSAAAMLSRAAAGPNNIWTDCSERDVYIAVPLSCSKEWVSRSMYGCSLYPNKESGWSHVRGLHDWQDEGSVLDIVTGIIGHPGKPGDPMTINHIAVTPDPPQLGKDLTVAGNFSLSEHGGPHCPAQV